MELKQRLDLQPIASADSERCPGSNADSRNQGEVDSRNQAGNAAKPRRMPAWLKRVLVFAGIVIAMLAAVGAALVGGIAWGERDYAKRHALFLSTDEYYLPVDSTMLTVQLVPLKMGPAAQAALLPPGQAACEQAAALIDATGLSEAARRVTELYGLDCETSAPLTIPDEFFDAGRQQYRVDQVLNWLIGECDPAAFRTVGVLNEDIYAPGFNFLFGQSTLGGNCCVASCARMVMNADSVMQARERWHSIVTHELGHSLGLTHNEDWNSVMAFGNSLSELDQQGIGLLAADRQRLESVHPIRWQWQD